LHAAEGAAVPELLDSVLIVGGSGQVGRALRAALAGARVAAPPRAELDVERPDSVAAALERYRPTLVVNTSAYHQVERCEQHPERAFAVNALAVDRLAAACAAAGAAFATFSTDYVFGGDAREPYAETDPANPVNAYGASKLAGEHLTRRHSPRHFIVRTSGVYSAEPSAVKGPTFVARVLAQAEAGQPVRVVDDVTFSPSYAPDVARGLIRLAQREAYGTYHLAGAGAVTWHAFATAAFELAGLAVRPEAVTSAAFPSVAKRPAYSALRSEALPAAGLAPLRPWREALSEFIAARERPA